MNRCLIGIISYLPQDNELRQRRLETHKLQLNWIKNVFMKNGPIDLKCIYQCYTPEEVPDILNTTEYDLYDHGLHIAPARNKILEYFYNNDIYDACVMLDDDLLLYDYYNVEYFLQDLLNSNSKYINIIIPLEPRNEPFKQFNTEFEDIITNNWTLQECPPRVNGVYILYKNIKKHNIYFKDLDMNKFEGFEDMEFMLNLLRHNIKPYKCRQLITKTLLQEDSTWAQDRQQRMDIRPLNFKALCEQYKDLQIQPKYDKTGAFNGFTQPIYHSEQPDDLTIPRSIPYKTPEELLYKQKRKNVNTDTLF